MALQAAEKIVTKQGYTGLSARKIAAQSRLYCGKDIILPVNARMLDQLLELMRCIGSEQKMARAKYV